MEPSTPEAGGHQEDGEDELVGDLHIPDPESDGEGGLAQLYFDPDREYDEDDMAHKGVRKELQSRRKGRSFFKPKGSSSKGHNKGKFPTKKGHHKQGGPWTASS